MEVAGRLCRSSGRCPGVSGAFWRTARIGKWTFSTNAVTISGVYGIPAVGFGPGQEAMAHAPDEKTPVEDLVNAAAFYAIYAWTA